MRDSMEERLFKNNGVYNLAPTNVLSYLLDFLKRSSDVSNISTISSRESMRAVPQQVGGFSVKGSHFDQERWTKARPRAG